MSEVIAVNKPIGITSYDVLRELKRKYPGQKIGHAGTLDPLASGVLICLIGSRATRRQAEFMNVSKDYEFDVLFGVSTDTYDILGLRLEDKSYEVDCVESTVNSNLDKFKGKIMQGVPPFSAVKIQGKPLYRWYLEGKINEVEVPIKEVEVEELNIISSEILSKELVISRILELVDTVKSGFRQKQVHESWEEFFEKTTQENFLIMKLKATVSKGTYVRAIANDLGKAIGIPACTTVIKRTRVGEFNLTD